MGLSLAICLLIAPGFMGWWFYKTLRRSRREITACSLGSVYESILFGVWTCSVNLLLLRVFYRICTVEDWVQCLNRLDFVLCVLGFTIISMFLALLIWEILFFGFIPRMAERIARMHSLPIPSDHRTVLNAVFLNDNRPHAVLIEKDGKVIGRGLIKNLNCDNRKLKEVYLQKITDQLTDTLKIRGTYINFETNITIREYEWPVREAQNKMAARKTLKIKRR